MTQRDPTTTSRDYQPGDLITTDHQGRPRRGWITAHEPGTYTVELEDPDWPDAGPFVGHGGTVQRTTHDLTLITPAAADTCGSCLVPLSEISMCGYASCPQPAAAPPRNPVTAGGGS